MLRCSYIVLIHNNESNIPQLIDSLTKVKGDFIKEFIIVDDGSTDSSLSVLKASARELPRTTILSQEESGSTVSINKAISLAGGDYVHFVEGGEIVHPDSTLAMMEACRNLGADVAFGRVGRSGSVFDSAITVDRVIQVPIVDILSGKMPEIRNIGKSGSLVSLDLLRKINKADNSIYTHNLSLSLRCAKYSNFVFMNDFLSLKGEKEDINNKFMTYNDLKSIYNFISENQDFVSPFVPDLLYALSLKAPKKFAKLRYSTSSLLAKYVKYYNVPKILSLYEKELEKLF